MAKKKTSKKSASKRTAPGRRKASTGRKTTRKAAATRNKTTRKKAAKKKAAKKKAARKKVAKKKAAKKKAAATATKKTASSATRRKTSKKVAGRKKTARRSAGGTRITRKKTYLTPKDLKHYRNLLLIRRAELLGDMNSISEEALKSESSDLSHMPIHMADVGSDNYGKELMLGLAESERRTIYEIDDALQRIVDGTYGICEATGKRIGKARLNAKPWAKYCIEAARQMERHNNHY